MGSSKTRKSSCPIINLVLSLFKFILLILSVASFSADNLPQNAYDISRLRTCDDLIDLNYVFFRRLLLSILLYYPFCPPHRLLRRPIARDIGSVRKREMEPLDFEICKGSEGSEASGEIGVRDFDGDVCDAYGDFDSKLRGA
ncbi:hypothetical protein ACS0TY_032562 [Phlomoides rotata]